MQSIFKRLTKIMIAALPANEEEIFLHILAKLLST
jgi:hypothetical protein